jgi:hypothetical protein
MLSIFVWGCSAVPQVRYREKDDMKENYIPIALLGSRVAITKPEAAGAETGKDDTPEKRVAALGLTKTSSVSEGELANQRIVVAPAQAKSTIRYIDPKQGVLHKTNLSITYFDGLKVAKTVGVEVQDETVKLIQALGAVAGAVGTVALVRGPAKKEGPITLPIVIDLSDPSLFADDHTQACQPLRAPNTDYCFTYELTPKEGRDMLTSTQFYGLYTEEYTNKLPFSRCVDVTLKIRRSGAQAAKEAGEIAVFTTTIADPLHVDWLPMPVKGSITMQSVCGADSKTEKSDSPGAFDMVEAVGKQVDAVWKAWHPSAK